MQKIAKKDKKSLKKWKNKQKWEFLKKNKNVFVVDDMKLVETEK